MLSRSRIAIVNILTALSFLSVHAKETADSAVAILPEVTLGEVAVTTIKGGDRPNADEAVSYIGAKAIGRYDLINLKQAAALAPNVYIPAYGSRMTSSIYVRGLGTRIDQPVVGLNIDNVPILNKDNYDFDLVDIDRIEILRGPQNILYGRNTMGGLMNIYTLSPLSYEGVKARISYGTQESYRVAAGVYGRISQKVGMSITGDITGTNGFYRNTSNNSPVGREKLGSLRWKTAVRPGNRVVVENMASMSHARQNGYPYENLREGRIAYNDTCYYSRWSFIDGLTVKHSFKDVTFSSIMSFQYLDDDMTLDQDFTTDDYFTLTQRRKEWALTGDFVARGPQGRRYSWLAGAFGFYRHTHMDAPVTFYGTGIQRLIVDHRNEANPYYPIAWDEDNFTLGSSFRMPAGGFSIYHESALNFGAFTITGGLRFDWERTSLNYRSFCSTAYTVYDNSAGSGGPLPVYRHAPIGIDERDRISHDYKQLLPKLSVSYQLPAAYGNIFASATKGYKAGGYNTQMFSDFLQQRIMSEMGLSFQYDVDQTVAYRPETDWNFELGAHLSLLSPRPGSDGHSLTADASLFWIEVNNQQVTMFPEGSITGRVMANAGKSRSRGVELALNYEAPAGWFARGSYGFTDAKFIRFDNGRSDFSGKRVPYAPRNTIFLGAGITRRFSGFIDSATLELNTRGVGNIMWDEANTLSQPFYMLLNASLQLRHRDFGFEIRANNITSTKYATFYFVSIGNAFLQRGNGFSGSITLSYSLSR